MPLRWIPVVFTRAMALVAAIGTGGLVQLAGELENAGGETRARVETGPHYLPSASEGRFDGVVVLEITGPASVARLARGVEADVSLAGVPLGRFVALRTSPLLAETATFRLVVSFEAPAATPASTLLGEAIAARPTSLELRLEARVVLTLGSDVVVSLDERVPVVTDGSQPATAPTPAAFTA